MITYTDYQKLAERTVKLPPLGSGVNYDMTRQRLIHAVMGLCSESGELAENVFSKQKDRENMREEIGDCCWYAAEIFNALGRDLYLSWDTDFRSKHRFHGLCDMISLLAKYVGAVATRIKAHVIYGKELNTEELAMEAALVMGSLSMICDAYCLVHISVVMEENIVKLQKRYPEKYSDSAAIARADKIEGEK